MSLRCVPLSHYCKLVDTTPDAITKKVQRGTWLEGVQVLHPPGDRERWIDLDEVEKWARTTSLCRVA